MIGPFDWWSKESEVVSLDELLVELTGPNYGPIDGVIGAEAEAD